MIKTKNNIKEGDGGENNKIKKGRKSQNYANKENTRKVDGMKKQTKKHKERQEEKIIKLKRKHNVVVWLKGGGVQDRHNQKDTVTQDLELRGVYWLFRYVF